MFVLEARDVEIADEDRVRIAPASSRMRAHFIEEAELVLEFRLPRRDIEIVESYFVFQTVLFQHHRDAPKLILPQKFCTLIRSNWNARDHGDAVIAFVFVAATSARTSENHWESVVRHDKVTHRAVRFSEPGDQINRGTRVDIPGGDLERHRGNL